jgi:AcrR family transcriptional regulator
VPLNREQVLDAALTLADAEGVESLSMRKLAKAVGVEAMSLYHHVKNKDDLLDGLVDRVWAEMAWPAGAWRESLRERARATRAALRRHPWAIGLMEARSNPGPHNIAQHEQMLRVLREGGFSVADTARASSLLDAYVYGWALQEKALPEELNAEVAERMLRFADQTTPYQAEMLREHIATGGYDFNAEFEFGLEIVLSGISSLPRAPA